MIQRIKDEDGRLIQVRLTLPIRKRPWWKRILWWKKEQYRIEDIAERLRVSERVEEIFRNNPGISTTIENDHDWGSHESI